MFTLHTLVNQVCAVNIGPSFRLRRPRVARDDKSPDTIVDSAYIPA